MTSRIDIGEYVLEAAPWISLEWLPRFSLVQTMHGQFNAFLRPSDHSLGWQPQDLQACTHPWPHWSPCADGRPYLSGGITAPITRRNAQRSSLPARRPARPPRDRLPRLDGRAEGASGAADWLAGLAGLAGGAPQRVEGRRLANRSACQRPSPQPHLAAQTIGRPVRTAAS